MPFAPLRPPSRSAVELQLLRPQTVSALRRGEERALSSPESERASEAAGGVAVAVVSALCSLSPSFGERGNEPAAPPSFDNSWGFSVETSALPKKEKKEKNSVDSGDGDDSDEEEEEEEEGEGEEQEAAAVGRTPSALSLSFATYAAAWCSFEKRSDEGSGATENREKLPASAASAVAVAAATTSSRSLSAAAASVPALLDAAFARRSPGLVVAAAQLASVSAAAAAEEAAEVSTFPSPSTSSSESEAARRLLSHLAHAMSFVPSSSARNACYQAWEATLRALPTGQRAAECARLADEAASSSSSPSWSKSSPCLLPSERLPPNAALEALALHHLASLVAFSWPDSSSSSSSSAEKEKRGEYFLAAAAALASAAADRLFPRSSNNRSSSLSHLGWGGSETSLLERIEPVAASLAALRLLLGRSRAAPLPPSVVSKLPSPLLALVSSDGEEHRRWRRRVLVNEALLPLRAAACSAAQGLRAAAGEAGKECAGGGSEAGLAVERLLDALARVLELAEA